MDITPTLTIEQVAKLLAAYAASDCGNKPMERVQYEHPNTFEGMVVIAQKWLNREFKPEFIVRRARDQKFARAFKGQIAHWTNDIDKATVFTGWKLATEFMDSLPKPTENWYVVDEKTEERVECFRARL